MKSKLSMPSAMENVRYAVSLSNSKKMTIDHKQPLSRGGTNNYNNLQLACLSCNRLKSNLTMQELADKIADITKYNRKQTFFRILGGLTQ